MKTLSLFALALLAVGCAKPEEPVADKKEDAPSVSTSAPVSGGPAPIGSGAMGGTTPMTGTDSVGGGGGFGVGQAAKDRARSAAGAASSSSLDQGGE